MAENMNYGTTSFPVHLPPEQIAAELEANPVALEDVSAAEHVRRALEHPIGSPRLKELVRAGDKVCIIVSDITRAWQSSDVFMPLLVGELEEAGVRDEDILILSATGTHRRQTEEEHIKLVSEQVYRRIRVEDHQCTDQENLSYVGTTSRGTPVWLDRRALECDKLILTGGVVYHFLAGYGGGRKSILPGIAGRETIMKNHVLALNPGLGSGSNPKVCSANMNETNPLHMDMMEACAMVNPTFLLNVVADDNQKIVGAFAGDWREAHQAACQLVDDMYGVRVKERTPLVIASTGGFPKDINIYQAVKTLCNALCVVEEKGTIILLARAEEGFGDPDCQRIIVDYPTLLDREKALRENFSIGAYIGYKFAETAENYHLILVTDLPQEQFGSAKLQAVKTLDEALALAWKEAGHKDLRATLLPHGANTLPKLG